MSFKHKTGRNRLLAEADKLPAASGEQHNHEANLHFVFISTRHPVLTEINLRLLSVRKLLDRMIGTRGSFRFLKIIGFSDPLDKRVDRSSRYLRKIRVMLLQPVFNLSYTAVRIVGNPILDELFIRLQFSEAPLLQSKKRTEFLISHAEELAHCHSVHARLSADLFSVAISAQQQVFPKFVLALIQDYRTSFLIYRSICLRISSITTEFFVEDRL